MKTTIDLTDKEAEAVVHETGLTSVEEAVIRVIHDWLALRERRRHAAQSLYGSMPDLMSQEELQRMRETP